VNVFLIVIGVIIFAAIIAINIYILVYFQHEEDKNTAYFPKIVVVAGLTLTCVDILLLPFDVGNTTTNGGIPMEIIWQVVYILIAIVAVAILPFTLFYYEAEDPSSTHAKQIRTAFCYEGITLVIFVVFTVVLWLTVGVAQVPVDKFYSPLIPAQNFTACTTCSAAYNQEIDFRVSFVLYIISMLALVGMVLFVVFGGIGLAALPLDLINGYRERPRFLPIDVYLKKKQDVGQRAAALIENGQKLEAEMGGTRAKTRKQATEFNRFRTAVYLLENDWKKLEKSRSTPAQRLLQIIWDYVQLILGILGIVISIVWLLHIILYVVPVSLNKPPIHPFLNAFFIVLDSAFGLFGTAAYGLFSFYLLWCVYKGNFKFGVRIPFLFQIHPMKVGETLMNAFLFNTLVLLLASVTVVQFCTIAFAGYNSNTAIDRLFNIGVRYLTGIKYVWFYYFWFLLGFAVIGIVYLAFFPSDRKTTQRGITKKESKKAENQS